MKNLLLVPLLLLGTMPAFAREYQSGYSNQCFKEVYREQYIPGTRTRPGRVERYTETVEVPCQRTTQQLPTIRPSGVQTYDNNSCIEGSILGGIAGGAAGAALSRDEGNFIGIPLGIVGGALIGCQIDGG